MDRKKIEIIHLNGKMAEQDPDALLERFNLLHEASQAIASDYLESLPEDVPPPSYFDDAVNYATNLIYATGSPIFSADDITRTIENQMGFAKLKETHDWLPDDTDKMMTVATLIRIGSELAMQDQEPVYRPHIEGRPHEILDAYDTDYNKFGILINKR